MRFPHTIRLDGPDGSLRITRRVADVTFRNDAAGGYGSGSFTLDQPIAAKQVAQFSDVLIFDGRHGGQVGGGRILTPGRSNDQDGQVSKIEFVGEGIQSMQDVNRPYVYIDGSLDAWTLYKRTTGRLDCSQTVYPNQTDDDTTLLMQAKDGTVIHEDSELIMINRTLAQTRQFLGGLGFRHKSGVISNLWRVRGRAYSTDFSASNTVIDDDWDTTISARRKMTVNGDFAGKTIPSISWKRQSSDHNGDDDSWSAARDIIYRAQLYGQDRELRTTGYTNEYVLAHEVFIDWIAANCPRLDIDGATIAQGTYQFDQLAWPDGIDGMGVMDEILAIEQGLMWGVFEKQANGLHRVALEVLPTTVRYDLTAKDGYSDSSPGDDLYNVVYVTWTSAAGKAQITRVPSTGRAPVPELDAADVTRSTTLALGSDVGSTTQATKRGQTFLAEQAVVPNGGQLTISGDRRIYDRYLGRYVAPWEIVPGHLANIKGVRPRVDALNPTGGPDGATRGRILSMAWQDSRGTAVLEIDSYTLTVRKKIADLINHTPRRPR